MPYEKAINVLQGGAVMAECGPMRLLISAFVGKLPQPDMGVRAGEEAFKYLERLAHARGILCRRFYEVPKDLDDPLAIKMVESVAIIGDEDFTPMAAVAGTIADEVADFLFKRGMTRVIVDNGGDVAIRLQGGEPVTVGIRNSVGNSEISNIISFEPAFSSWGVATSGMGGRSLTRGVASAATVIARCASLADAAATAIANASFVEDDHVIQRPAEVVDPDTDITGLPVTVEVGALSEKKKAIAVARAMERAEELIENGAILGAFVAVQGRTDMTDFFRDCLIE